MAEIGLPVVEVIEVGIPPEDDGKGVGDSGLIPILSEIESSCIQCFKYKQSISKLFIAQIKF